MARFADDLKTQWEDDTLRFFFWFRGEAGGPEYELVARGERPDRRIRAQGDSKIIGAELTRMVVGQDAGQRRFAFHLGADMAEVLGAHGQGGHVFLYAGKFPGTTRAGRAKLCVELRRAIEAAGDVRQFVECLTDGQLGVPGDDLQLLGR